jgi:hypothetical protein
MQITTNAPQTTGSRYAIGHWMHLFGPGDQDTRCRIVIDLQAGNLVAAQLWSGITYLHLVGKPLADLTDSVINVNEAHLNLDDWMHELADELPDWAKDDFGQDDSATAPPPAAQPVASTSTVSVSTALLSSLASCARVHIEDVESGLTEGLYRREDNTDIGAKRVFLEEALKLLESHASHGKDDPERLEKLQALGHSSEAEYQQHERVLQASRALAERQLQDSSAFDANQRPQERESYLVLAVGKQRAAIAQCFAQSEAHAEAAVSALAADSFGEACTTKVFDRGACPGFWLDISMEAAQAILRGESQGPLLPRPGTKLVEVSLSAYTRLEHVEVVEVPEDITAKELNELANLRYQQVDGGEYVSDPGYWERGTCETRTYPSPGLVPMVKAYRTPHGLSVAPIAADLGDTE